MPSRTPDDRPHDLCWTTFQLGSETFGVLSYSVFEGEQTLRELTAAENAVAELVFAGLGNAAIAAARSSSPRTVANQIASIFRKLCIGSRVELVALLAERRCSGLAPIGGDG